eukprot:XP_001704342.1 Hypothetical protein GL50803_120021 [Giardia lamblia ATCC 50803]
MPGRWPRPPLSGAGRISPPLSANTPTPISCRGIHMGRMMNPSRPAWRVISAITSFGSPLPWGLLETSQEGGLLPLSAPTPSVDRRAMLLHQACRLCDYPRHVTVVTMEDECAVSMGNERGISFSSR